jgi:uncharacterized protein
MRIALALLLSACSAQAVFAADAADTRASEASVRQLFEVMHTSSMLDALMAQIDNSARTSMSQAVAGQPLNERQKQIVGDMQGKLMALMKQQLTWADLEPAMIEVYRNTFTQKEVDGMLQFYRTDAGRAVVSKLPVVMQQMSQRMQVRMHDLTPQVMQLEQDTAAQLKAAAGEVSPR